jgi:hypothetical protein
MVFLFWPFKLKKVLIWGASSVELTVQYSLNPTASNWTLSPYLKMVKEPRGCLLRVLRSPGNRFQGTDSASPCDPIPTRFTDPIDCSNKIPAQESARLEIDS